METVSQSPFQIAICNEIYRDWSFEDAFRHASQCGYDGVEIAPFTIEKNAFDTSEARCKEIVAIAQQNDLQIIGLHWLLAFTDGLHLTSRTKSVQHDTAEYLQQLAKVCHWLGGSVMVFGSPQQRNRHGRMSIEEANRLAVDCLQSVIPALEANQVTLALEPLGPEEGNFMTTAKWGRELVSSCGSPNIQLHLDVKAMTTEGDSIPDIISDSRDVLVHFHANDPNRRGPGMGDVCFRPIVAALREIGYEGWLSVETFDESVPPEQTATESIRYLRNLL